MGIKLLYLPPYSPDYNPIKDFFSASKAFLHHNVVDFQLAVESGEADTPFNFLYQIVEEVRKVNPRGWFQHAHYVWRASAGGKVWWVCCFHLLSKLLYAPNVVLLYGLNATMVSFWLASLIYCITSSLYIYNAKVLPLFSCHTAWSVACTFLSTSLKINNAMIHLMEKAEGLPGELLYL